MNWNLVVRNRYMKGVWVTNQVDQSERREHQDGRHVKTKDKKGTEKVADKQDDPTNSRYALEGTHPSISSGNLTFLGVKTFHDFSRGKTLLCVNARSM
ncbi:hypothetical protein BaRGS_00022514 [Batillaria attramentaria]|uniref:Uncharacterized protein n=1 Tax=Batillaria attramentaria TaxID=370345 RepID=A0ABD0KG63_9CAEN